MKKLIISILVVAWAIVIFWFSAQDASRSSQQSGKIVEQIIRIIEPDFEELPVEHRLSLRETLGLLVRKGAHFSEYLLLGILLWWWFRIFELQTCRLPWLPWAAGTLYALSDEFHQMFSEGRSPQFLDVGIDSAGVLCGVALCVAVSFAGRRMRQRNK